MDQKWKIIYYISTTGENPVKKFLDAHPKAKLKALRILSHSDFICNQTGKTNSAAACIHEKD